MLFAELELLEDREVAGVCCPLQVVKETTALGHELEETATGSVVFLVRLEVRGEVEDALGEKCNLHVRATCVFGVETKGFHFVCCCCCHL